MKCLYVFFCMALMPGTALTQTPNENHKLTYSADSLIYFSHFGNGLDTHDWQIEMDPQPNSSVYVKNNRLILDTRGGVTVWLKKQLTGNILIEYKRKVLVDSGSNDRLSDLNNFWMASDPHNANLLTRHGVLEEYDSLQ